MKYDKKRKPRGMKHKIREGKKRQERVGLAVTVAVLIVIFSVSGFFIHSMLSSPTQKQETSSTLEPKAALVDHLSLTAPNQTFIQIATDTLKQAEFTVDYYKNEEVTVDFYRNLPTHGYGLIILRAHSTATEEREGEKQQTAVTLFSSEHYSTTKYVYEQLTDQVGRVVFAREGEDGTYFGIRPKFVELSMNGRFDNTTIIMMGCTGIRNTFMARAFIEKGAKVYIGWNGPVLPSHTDLTTTHLLQHLLLDKQTIRGAIRQTMKDVGPDPAYKSVLLAYPIEAWEHTVQNIVGNVITNNTMEIKYIPKSIAEKKWTAF